MEVLSICEVPDYHTHHELCRHATGRTVDYARSAAAAGLREFAATDHCPTDVGFGREHRMELGQFNTYLHDVAAARSAFPKVIIRLGVEADFYPECEAFLAPFLNRYPFDLVLGSVHFRDYWAEESEDRGLHAHGRSEVIWREYFSLIGRLADTRLYDIVTHLDLPKRFGNPSDARALREAALPALDRIAAAGMAIEINTSGMIHSIHEMYPSLHLLTWAWERGVGLVFGSDAHSPDRVGDGFATAIDLAREAGYTEARRYEQRKWTSYTLPATDA
jgi:histidinol-phosphatase (PHP family)